MEKSDNNQNKLVSVNVQKSLEKLPTKKINLKKLFHKVSVLDYAVMWFIANKAENASADEKFYLKDMAQSSGISMNIITEMVRKLRDKGFVEWTHDGNGENGTYVKITKSGAGAVIEQRDILHNFHKNVIDEFGSERFLKMICEMAEFEEIMNKEIEKENIKDE